MRIGTKKKGGGVNKERKIGGEKYIFNKKKGRN